MSSNLYSEKFRMGFFNGNFSRCRHGYTGFNEPCWRCGLFHPWLWLKDWWRYGR